MTPPRAVANGTGNNSLSVVRRRIATPGLPNLRAGNPALFAILSEIAHRPEIGECQFPN